MQIGDIFKIKLWDPRIVFRSERTGVDQYFGAGTSTTQLEHGGVPCTNIKTVKKTIGAVGVTGCDFNFVTANDVVEQPIDLGAIVPAFARVLDVKTVTETAFAHAATAIASWSVDTNVVTITTAAPHGLVSTNSVVIAGMTETAINGTHTITRLADTTFTLALVHADALTTVDTTGTVTFTAVAIAAETGNATSGNQFISSATIKALNAITAAAAGAPLAIAPAAAASNVWVSATPSGKWVKMTTGKLAVYVTYISV